MFEHHFIPLHPAPRDKTECDSLIQMGSITWRTKAGYSLSVRLLGPGDRISVIAICIPEEAAEHQNKPKWLREIVELLVASIRLNHDPEAHLVHIPSRCFTVTINSENNEIPYATGLSLITNRDIPIDISRVLSTTRAFNTKVGQSVAALLAESNIPSMPPHYSILSLVRAAELLWPDEADFNAALDVRDADFAKLGLSKRTFRKALPEIRNRCTHGRGRGRHDTEPLAGVGFMSPLAPLVDLLTEIVTEGVRELGPKLTIRQATELRVSLRQGTRC